jgi:NAD(P)-dependent dehydrogenase (short-subunit alcohol dehydrogenase family)
MDIGGATAIVTGGASGLGAATAAVLAEHGAHVAVLDLAPGRANTAAMQLTVDVGDAAAVDRAVDAVAAALGPPRIVVCCAGVGGFARIARRSGPHPVDVWERIIRVNLTGTFLTCNAALRHLSTADPTPTGERGVLITTSSISGLDGPTGAVAYAASKGGVAAMTLPMARDLGELAIRVVSIAPGSFDTPLLAGMPAAAVDAMAAAKPFPRRSGRPEEFAMTVRHVVVSEMLNGCVIRLDGGERMGWP